MTSPIQGIGGNGMTPRIDSTPMTESLRASFQKILARYDVEHLSQTDCEALTNELRQAGIGRTREVRSLLEQAGVAVEKLDKAGPTRAEDGSGRPRPMSGGINVRALQSFQDILSNYDLTNMSAADEQNLMNDLTSSGLLQAGLILNIQA